MPPRHPRLAPLVPLLLLTWLGCGERLEVATVVTDLYDPAMGVNPGAWYYDFNPAEAMRGAGWSGLEGTEENHQVWITQPDARVEFALTPVDPIYSICAGYQPLYAEPLRGVDQNVAVLVNGSEVVTFRTHGIRKPGFLDWCTTIPASILKNGANEIALRPSSFVTPASVGMGGDGRTLSIQVDYLSVFPARFGKLTKPLAARVAAGAALNQPKLSAEALELGSGGIVALPIAVPPGGLLEFGLPSEFVERGGVLELDFAPRDKEILWKERVSPATRPVRSLYSVNYYRVSLSAIERSAGTLRLSYAPDHVGQPDSALIVAPLILKPRGAGQ